MGALHMNGGSSDEPGRLRDRRRKRCQDALDGFLLCGSPFDQKGKSVLEKGEKYGVERVEEVVWVVGVGLTFCKSNITVLWERSLINIEGIYTSKEATKSIAQ